mmetsp:Transcript_13284/g.33378  ORF Transcript_13284/g.33378 Transcript_13284/m.33378 type:complete len:226 (+) Transcript_13284:75-752(+)
MASQQALSWLHCTALVLAAAWSVVVLPGADAAAAANLRQRALRTAEAYTPTQDEAGLFGPAFSVPLLKDADGSVAAEVQMRLAISPQEHQHGLMFRKNLDAEEGMLFMYTGPQKRVLWMKNTYVPLEAAWFTQDGEVREMQHLAPFDLTYRWSQRDDISMGLELPEGFFERNKLPDQGQGLHLDMKALASSLAQRGVDPAAYLGAAGGQGSGGPGLVAPTVAPMP